VSSHPIASIFYLQRKIDGYGMFGFAHHPSTQKPPFLAFMLLYQYSGRGNINQPYPEGSLSVYKISEKPTS